MTGDRKPISIVRTKFDERNAQFSPDGRWIAYQSDESGRYEVFLRTFDRAGQSVPVSPGGGEQPRWRRDGRELFYIAPDGRLMSVPIGLSRDGQNVEPGTPAALFDTHIRAANPFTGGIQYMVADGQRFLVSKFTANANTSPITVILNWHPKN
jgi:hypothetical protein